MRQVFLRRTGRPRGLCEAAAAAAGRHWIASAFPFISLLADIARRPPCTPRGRTISGVSCCTFSEPGRDILLFEAGGGAVGGTYRTDCRGDGVVARDRMDSGPHSIGYRIPRTSHVRVRMFIPGRKTQPRCGHAFVCCQTN